MPVGDRPVDPGDDPRLRALATGAEHLDADEPCPGRDAAEATVGTGIPLAGERAGHVGAVAVVVVGPPDAARRRAAIGKADDLPLVEVAVPRVDARIDHRGDHVPPGITGGAGVAVAVEPWIVTPRLGHAECGLSRVVERPYGRVVLDRDDAGAPGERGDLPLGHPRREAVHGAKAVPQGEVPHSALEAADAVSRRRLRERDDDVDALVAVVRSEAPLEVVGDPVAVQVGLGDGTGGLRPGALRGRGRGESDGEQHGEREGADTPAREDAAVEVPVDAASVDPAAPLACILPRMSMCNAPLRVALGQLNATVGDLDGNARKIADMAAAAREQGAALIVFPELALCGYPPEDLLLKPGFLDAARRTLEELAAETTGIVALVGFPERADDVYNAAAVLADGRVLATYRKMFLPNYGVFDEHRYFQVGERPALLELSGADIGVTICEDVWEPGPPATSEAHAGAQLIANLSASPYHAGKPLERERMLAQRARDSLVAIAFCNLVGGQDELVFDGMSAVIDERGEVLARAPQFDEALTLCTVDLGAVAAERLRDASHREAVRRERADGGAVARLGSVEVSGDEAAARAGGDRCEPLSPEPEIYGALVTGLRDYVDKNGFSGVVVGLSGGVDSALTAVVAVDALGAERVSCVVMPSRYSSEGTQEDARQLARNLGVRLFDLEIEAPMKAYDEVLAEPFEGFDPDITEENIQARIRGNLLMALSNKFGWLVLVTGNKSELSVGYSTLYGDMAGGFGPIKDVFKRWVYRLLRWREDEADGELVPPEIVDRAPTAELRYEQSDEDDLPPYELLDQILAGYVEEDLDDEQLLRQGLPRDEVERTIAMVDGAEHKRRQAPPGIRISTKAFGRDRRLPITNRFSAGASAR